ncbi:gluconate 2-dehydrogenase subunit 3 family protein [Hyphomicrobium sp.]|uniref:gluconate 2-dehydrogenase subunit 3 family protein n=1 Tax=Hyphomicrobium sp. TaxID=82 RepID=UPI0025C39469|nr:gluconate 2-dehydrogenase subunit 3 family protein [Hyphomicrobium sp.]MCC7253034.1 gluconate 2-dehydrogenase subunit 3 family protein [Hyphomicrobium sp.]
MRVVDKTTRVGRREFLRTTAGAAAVAAVAPTVSGQALAEPLKTVTSPAAATLVQMARDLYPHDALPTKFYQSAVSIIDTEVSGSADTINLLADGAVELDAAAKKLKGMPYAAIADEVERVAVLKSIESTPFFARMRSGMVTALYNQHDLWIKFGYEGPSFEKGGYLHRGFDDIDWLP